MRAAPLVERLGGPVVDVGSGNGSPGIPLAHALPSLEVVLLEAERRRCEFLGAWAPPNARVVWGRAEEQATDWAGAALAKALAPPPVAAEWCLPLVRPGGAALLWLGESADLAELGRVARQLAAELESRRRGSRAAPEGGPDAAGIPAPAGDRPQAPAANDTSSRERLPSRGGRPRLRIREPEGRRRQDDDDGEPRRLPRRGGRASARGRPRPAGERDLGPRDARERHVELRPAGRRPRRGAREADGLPEPLRDPVAARARGRGGGAVAPLRRRELPRLVAGGGRGLRLRAARLPAVPRPADGQRACGGRPGDRAGAGGVLRARGPRPAAALDQPDQGAPQHAPRDRRAC